MSHDSGFRKGGKDFTHNKPPRPQKGGRKGFEQRMARRFHDHEKDAQTEAPAAEEEKPADAS